MVWSSLGHLYKSTLGYMAAAPDTPLVPVDEYLNTSYSPDVEYVDGVLVERGMPTSLHSIFQAMLAAYFWKYCEQLGFIVYTEPRTQIVERARYRLPDVMLAPLPAARGKFVATAPWVVIEIQSPGTTPRDSYGDARTISQSACRT